MNDALVDEEVRLDAQRTNTEPHPREQVQGSRRALGRLIWRLEDAAAWPCSVAHHSHDAVSPGRDDICWSCVSTLVAFGGRNAGQGDRLLIAELIRWGFDGDLRSVILVEFHDHCVAPDCFRPAE